MIMIQCDVSGIYCLPGKEVNQFYVVFIAKGQPATMDPVLAAFVQELVSSLLQHLNVLFIRILMS